MYRLTGPCYGRRWRDTTDVCAVHFSHWYRWAYFLESFTCAQVRQAIGQFIVFIFLIRMRRFGDDIRMQRRRTARGPQDTVKQPKESWVISVTGLSRKLTWLAAEINIPISLKPFSFHWINWLTLLSYRGLVDTPLETPGSGMTKDISGFACAAR